MYTIVQIKDLINKNSIYKFYNDRCWRQLSDEVIKEQKECQYCKAKGKYSPAELTHHVKEVKKYPELAYSKYYTDEHGNIHRQLVALCQQCHEEQHTNRFHRRKKERFYNQERW